MKPGGVIAFHVTNRFLNLIPVVEALAHAHGLHMIHIADEAESTGREPQRLAAAVRPSRARSTGRRSPKFATEIDAAPGLAAVDRRLQQPGAGAEVDRRTRNPRLQSPPCAQRRRRPRAIPPPTARSCTRPARATSRRSTSARCRTRSSTAKIADADMAALAIRGMWVRGAPLIGAVGAYGLALALDRDASDAALAKAHAALDATRPTAVNLRWALDRVRAAVAPLPERERGRRRVARGRRDLQRGRGDQPRDRRARARAAARASRARKAGPVSVMTHCNAGALATCGWGTATAPLFLAHAEGLRAARLGERDAAAAAGRQPDRLGDGPARRAAHAVRRRRAARC